MILVIPAPPPPPFWGRRRGGGVNTSMTFPLCLSRVLWEVAGEGGGGGHSQCLQVLRSSQKCSSCCTVVVKCCTVRHPTQTSDWFVNTKQPCSENSAGRAFQEPESWRTYILWLHNVRVCPSQTRSMWKSNNNGSKF